MRSSSHTLKYTNVTKRNLLATFITEYRRVLQLYLDKLWDEGICVSKDYHLDLSKNKLKPPSVLPTEFLNVETFMSARARQCCGKQACAMIKAAVKKRSKQFFMLKNYKGKVKTPPSYKVNR